MSIVLRRFSPVRVLLCVLAGLCAGSGDAAAAAPCPGAAPAVELRIVAGGIAPELDRTTVVEVHDDGCVQVHRPGYRRDAGEYRLDLDPAALANLRSRVEHPAVRAFDAKRLGNELAAADRKRTDAGATHLSEPDADYYELRWLSAGKAASAGWPGLPAVAANHADNATLKHLATAAQALEALAGRSDAQRIDGGTP